MPSIVSSGIGSGLDIGGIVQQLVAAEGQPLDTRLGLKEVRAQGKLSAFGSLKSALSAVRDKLDAMKSLDKFLARKATSGNQDVFTVSAGTNAVPANYTVEVVQTASSQKLTSGAFSDENAVVGIGSLTIDVGASRMILDIPAEKNTLSGIRDAINASKFNPGVSATIVNADAGSYLILTANGTGASNTITITQAGGDGGLAALEYDPANSLVSMTESIPAQDALIRIDGLDVMSSSNTFASAVQGVTISVLDDSGGQTELLKVENDLDSTKTLVNDFVKSYNELITMIDSLTAYNSESDQGAPLLGDSTIRGIRDQIRRELSTSVVDIDANFSRLSDVGIEVQLNGQLTVNDARLSDILSEDFVKFGQLFATTDGFATRLHNLASGFLESDGIIESRTQGLKAQIDGISDDREALNDRLASLETRLLKQFNALDSLLAQLSSTSNFLNQQLGNLPGIRRANDN
jgi:flagellar hook-associated protein 2